MKPLLGLLCALLAAACGHPAATAPGPVARTIVFLTDLSESARKPEMRKLYADTFSTVGGRLTHGDQIVVACITERSAAELSLPINESFSAFAPTTDNELIAQGQRRRAEKALAPKRAALQERFAALLDDPGRRSIMHTDLFGSLELAQRVFRNRPAATRILVVLSDMVQDADGVDFDRADLSAEPARRLIDTLRAGHRLPDLSGVKVYVVGAYYPDNARNRAIRDFWLSYFRAGGADLPPERYGAALIGFEP